MEALLERYHQHVVGKIECFDRIIIRGTLPVVSHAAGMVATLHQRGLSVLEYTEFVQPLGQRIKANAETLARQAGIDIEYVPSRRFRQKDRIENILKTRGRHPGLVHIFVGPESCTCFKARGRKGPKRLHRAPGRCNHYYFYFIDELFGLCHFRVSTWAPFAVQFYCNGHDVLARQLQHRGVAYCQVDNAIVECDDWQAAQKLADALGPEQLHRMLDRCAARFCPVFKDLGQRYHWSIDQAEFATDLVFAKRETLQPVYEGLVQTAVHAVKAEDVATFLGRTLHPQYGGDVGNRYKVAVEGTRIRHTMGPAGIKMYDKLGHVLRVETTVIDVSFFKHYRKVEHRDGTSTMKQAKMKRTIYSLPALRDVTRASNRRYLEFMAYLDDPRPRLRDVQKLAERTDVNGRSVRGFNLFQQEDYRLFLAIARGEFTISGLTNRRIRQVLPSHGGAQMSRLLKRLRVHGILKRIGKTYKYYLTGFGRRVVTAALRLRETVVLPALALPHST